VNKKLLRINKKDIINILILILIASAIGTYIIATTVLISRDGTKYISLAQRFSYEPTKVLQQKVPPGYPILIYLAHRATASFFQTSVYTWCYTAQGISLLCRILSIIPLYFIGKILVDRRKTFWALLILIFLPYPAVFGSDVLREWPHILFLSTGLLCLILGTRTEKWIFFVLAGIISALGHTIRPECAQIVIYCFLWMLIVLISVRPKITRIKAVCLMFVLLVAFTVPALTYMNLRGKVLPSKLKTVLRVSSNQQSYFDATVDITKLSVVTYAGPSQKFVKAFINLIQELSINLNYYFLLPLIIGLSFYFRRLKRIIYTELFFVLTLMSFYTVMMILLFTGWGYISPRHCMPMVLFSIFFIPFGIEIISKWMNKRILKRLNRKLIFIIVIFLGLIICFAKFTRITPMGWDKKGYLNAAKWIKENVKCDEKIAVPDQRITFYASREGIKLTEEMPKDLSYVVNISRQGESSPVYDRPYDDEYSCQINKKDNTKRVVIYKFY
jgi:4-amino-4-deoxy-L-arabinose transferase-like glycosyltransferase